MNVHGFIVEILNCVHSGKLTIKPYNKDELPTKEDNKQETKEVDLKTLKGVDF